MTLVPAAALSLARATHPGPTVVVTAVTVLRGVGVGLEPPRLALLGLAMLVGQASVGLGNDWLDAARDAAAGREDKPVAQGLVSAAAAQTAALVTAVAAVALTVPLGVPATLAHGAFIASAWSYNLGLKSTPASVVPYIISFGLLPMIVTLALPKPMPAALWAMGMGALLGIAAHFTNVIPDLEDDRRTGVRGLPHALGRRLSGIATFLALTAASVVAVLGAGGSPTAVHWLGMAFTLAIAAVGIVLVIAQPPRRLLFRLVLLAALVDVALLASSGQRILG
jgi:4-hydroxybenzoate polyprenyltransferase